MTFLQAHAPYWVFWALMAALGHYEVGRLVRACCRCKYGHVRFTEGGLIPERPGGTQVRVAERG